MEQHLATEPAGEQPEKKSPDNGQNPIQLDPEQPGLEQKASDLEPKAPGIVEPRAPEIGQEPVSLEPNQAELEQKPSEPEPAAPLIVEQAALPAPIEQRPPEPAAPPAAPPAPLEVWAQNERMPHVPSLAWMIEKLDGDLRKRIEMFVAVFEKVPSADPRHRPIEEALFGICRSLDRLADSARRNRGVPHPPAEIAHRIPWSINTALSLLRNVDASTFGRRYPFHTFERSGSESLYAALMVVIQQIEHAVPMIREMDPAIDERLYSSLVQLKEPMRTDAIA